MQAIHQHDNQMAGPYQGIRKQVQQGRRIYIVFPLTTESEKIDLKNLEAGFELLCTIFPDFRPGRMYGKMKLKEKDTEMQKFDRGETQVLVVMTVIEVGADVPNVSVMVALDTRRSGLSQLR